MRRGQPEEAAYSGDIRSRARVAAGTAREMKAQVANPFQATLEWIAGKRDWMQDTAVYSIVALLLVLGIVSLLGLKR